MVVADTPQRADEPLTNEQEMSKIHSVTEPAGGLESAMKSKGRYRQAKKSNESNFFKQGKTEFDGSRKVAHLMNGQRCQKGRVSLEGADDGRRTMHVCEQAPEDAT